MGVTYDFSDIEDSIQNFERELESVFEEEGKRFVKDAVETGSYHDITGNLRASNYYKSSGNGLEVGNKADYSTYVESKGYEVSTSAALRMFERLKMRLQ